METNKRVRAVVAAHPILGRAMRLPRLHSTRLKTALKSLRRTFPDCFGDIKGPITTCLKVGIWEDIIARGMVNGEGKPIARRYLKEALRVYTMSSAYQEALAAGAPRVDLAGRIVEIVSVPHRDNANVSLARLDSIRRFRRLCRTWIRRYHCASDPVASVPPDILSVTSAVLQATFESLPPEIMIMLGRSVDYGHRGSGGTLDDTKWGN